MSRKMSARFTIIALGILVPTGCGTSTVTNARSNGTLVASTGVDSTVVSSVDASSLDFRQRVRRALTENLPAIQDGLELVSRVDEFSVQRNFDQALATNSPGTAKSSRLIQLQRYFNVMKALQKAIAGVQVASFDALAGGLVDEATGDWKQAFKEFCRTERMELPPIALVHALRIAAEPDSSEAPVNVAATALREVITDGNVESFFAGLADSSQALGLAIARSMRHVKAAVRLELSSQARPVPFFMRALYSQDPAAPKAPDFAANGFDVKIAGWSAWYFLQYNQSLGKYDCVFRPLAETVSMIVKDYNPENIHYIDDYHYLCPELSDPAAIARVLSAVRETLPGAVVGFYGFVPAVDYWTLLKPDSDPSVVAYRNKNDERMRIVGDKVDLIMPSTYFVYAATLSPDDPQIQAHSAITSSMNPVNVDPGLQRWKQTRARLISESRRIASDSFAQPVVPFLWPQYYDGHGFQDVYVTGALYRMAVDHLLASGIDGLVHWDAVSRATLWDPSFADPADGRTSWYEALFP